MSKIRQSFSWWCFNNRGVEADALLAAAAKIGYEGVDLIDESLWPKVKEHGLKLAGLDGHGTIDNGLNRRENAARIKEELLVKIDKAVKWEIPVLICFSGNRKGQVDEEGLKICAETLSQVLPTAEKAGVVLAMELLNSKVDHADYQCDHTSWGVKLVKQLNSPSFKLLYDIYHMQIMEGDLIRTIKAEHASFGHYHTAGNPGRNDMDDTQELHYPPIYRAIAETGYKGYVGHEFIPKGDPIKALKTAFDQCAASV